MGEAVSDIAAASKSRVPVKTAGRFCLRRSWIKILNTGYAFYTEKLNRIVYETPGAVIVDLTASGTGGAFWRARAGAGGRACNLASGGMLGAVTGHWQVTGGWRDPLLPDVVASQRGKRAIS